VFNLDGELIAVTTSTAAVVGGESPGGFAIPMSAGMKRLIDVLSVATKSNTASSASVWPISTSSNGRRVVDQVTTAPRQTRRLRPRRCDSGGERATVRDYDDLFLHIAPRWPGRKRAGRFAVWAKTEGLVKLAKFSYPGPIIAANRPVPVFGLRVDYNSTVVADVPIPDGVAIPRSNPAAPASASTRTSSSGRDWIITHIKRSRF